MGRLVPWDVYLGRLFGTFNAVGRLVTWDV
jgi:hypothetical protein